MNLCCHLLLVKILRKKDDNFDKYKYFGYAIGFDARGCFLLSNGSRFSKIVIIFRARKISI